MLEFKQRAVEYDRNDHLARFKSSFFNDPAVIYLDGNSLGKMPLKAKEILQNAVEDEWGNRLIRSWNEKWIGLSQKLAVKIAEIVGAEPDEIFVGDSTSLNLYKLAFSALKIQKGRNEILTDDLNFPSDIYVFQGLVKNHYPKHKLRIIESKDGITTDVKAVEQMLNDKTALLSLSHVCYKSSYLHNMEHLTSLAHKNGTLTLWDLSHSVGILPVELSKANVDMAVGCTYKYLNGGPGAPAFLYVKKELQEKIENPIWSWFSHQRPFDFDPVYKASPGISKFALSTPQILSLTAIEPGLDLMLEAGISHIRTKNIQQIGFLEEMVKEFLLPLDFSLASPSLASHRGGHLTLRHKDGFKINRALIEPVDKSNKVIIPDFRPPDLIRLGVASMYTSYFEIYEAVIRIKQIVEHGEYDQVNLTDSIVP